MLEQHRDIDFQVHIYIFELRYQVFFYFSVLNIYKGGKVNFFVLYSVFGFKGDQYFLLCTTPFHESIIVSVFTLSETCIGENAVLLDKLN